MANGDSGWFDQFRNSVGNSIRDFSQDGVDTGKDGLLSPLGRWIQPDYITENGNTYSTANKIFNDRTPDEMTRFIKENAVESPNQEDRHLYQLRNRDTGQIKWGTAKGDTVDRYRGDSAFKDWEVLYDKPTKNAEYIENNIHGNSGFLSERAFSLEDSKKSGLQYGGTEIYKTGNDIVDESIKQGKFRGSKNKLVNFITGEDKKVPSIKDEQDLIVSEDFSRKSKQMLEDFGIDTRGMSWKEMSQKATQIASEYNWNLANTGLTALNVSKMDQEQARNFQDVMDAYNQTDTDLNQVGRGIKALATDPTTYLGLGTLGLGTVASQGAKQAVKQGLRQAIKTGSEKVAEKAIANQNKELLKKQALLGAIEGSAYSSADNALKQSVKVNAGDEFSKEDLAKSALLGAGLGGTLGALGQTVANKIGSNNTRNRLEDAIDVEKQRARATEDIINPVTGEPMTVKVRENPERKNRPITDKQKEEALAKQVENERQTRISKNKKTVRDSVEMKVAKDKEDFKRRQKDRKNRINELDKELEPKLKPHELMGRRRIEKVYKEQQSDGDTSSIENSGPIEESVYYDIGDITKKKTKSEHTEDGDVSSIENSGPIEESSFADISDIIGKKKDKEDDGDTSSIENSGKLEDSVYSSIGDLVGKTSEETKQKMVENKLKSLEERKRDLETIQQQFRTNEMDIKDVDLKDEYRTETLRDAQKKLKSTNKEIDKIVSKMNTENIHLPNTENYTQKVRGYKQRESLKNVVERETLVVENMKDVLKNSTKTIPEEQVQKQRKALRNKMDRIVASPLDFKEKQVAIKLLKQKDKLLVKMAKKRRISKKKLTLSGAKPKLEKKPTEPSKLKELPEKQKFKPRPKQLQDTVQNQFSKAFNRKKQAGQIQAQTKESIYKLVNKASKDFKEGIIRHLLETDYHSISKDVNTKEKADKFEQTPEAKKVLDKAEKFIEQSAKGVGNRSEMIGYNETPMKIASEVGLPKESIPVIDKLISIRAMNQNDSWDFVNKYKDEKSMKDVMDIVDTNKKRSKEHFKDNPEQMIKGFIKDVKKAPKKVDEDGKVIYDADSKYERGIIDLEHESSKIGKEKAFEYSGVIDRDLMQKERLRKIGNKLYKVADKETREKLDFSKDPAEILASTVESIGIKEAGRLEQKIIAKEIEDGVSKLVSNVPKEGMVELTKKEKAKLPKEQKMIKYVNKELKTQILGRDEVRLFANNDSHQLIKIIDRLLKEFGTKLKQNAVLKNTNSYVNASIVNYTTGALLGISPRKMTKYQRQALKEMVELNKIRDRQAVASSTGRKSNVKDTLRKQELLLDRLERNGLSTNRVEGLLSDSGIVDYATGKTSKALIGELGTKAGSNILLNQGTGAGKAVTALFTAIDTAGRYAVAKDHIAKSKSVQDLIKKGMSKENAILNVSEKDMKEAVDKANGLFADMDRMVHPLIEKLDAYGVAPFLKWASLSLPVTIKIAKENPIKALAITIATFLATIESGYDFQSQSPVTQFLDMYTDYATRPYDAVTKPSDTIGNQVVTATTPSYIRNIINDRRRNNPVSFIKTDTKKEPKSDETMDRRGTTQKIGELFYEKGDLKTDG